MAALEENLVKWLLADTTITSYVGSRVYVNTLGSDRGDFIFLRQSGSGYEDCLSDAAGSEPFRRFYDVECWSDDLANSRTLGQRVQTVAHLHTGTVGDTTVKRIFAADQDEDYVPKGDGSRESFHGTFLRMEVIP